MTETAIALLGAALGFLTKAAWDLWSGLRLDKERTARQKRIDFLERQLTEFYWPVFFQLQKNQIVWERLTSSVRDDEGLAAEIDYKLERDYFFPTNVQIEQIIEEKFHLVQPDAELEHALLQFMRHQAVFKALRESGKHRIDPVRLGEPWPKDLFSLIELKARQLQKRFDKEIGSNERRSPTTVDLGI